MALKPIQIEINAKDEASKVFDTAAQAAQALADDLKGVTQADPSQLSARLRDLAGALDGDLAREAQAAADALDNLGAKRQAIDNFQRLTAESGELAVELAQAETAVTRLERELPGAAAEVTKLAVAEARASQAAEQIGADLAEQKNALAALQREYTGSARRTEEYETASAQLRTTISSLTRDHAAANSALDAARRESADAAVSQEKLANKYTEAGQAAIAARGAVQQNAAALGQAASRMDELGIGTTELAQKERQLEGAVGRVTEEVRRLAPAFQQAAAASAASTQKQVADQERLRQNIQQVHSQFQKIQAIAGAAIGGGIFGGMVKSVADVSDGMKNLQARIELVTGQGESFAQSWSEVQRIALDTNSALEGTGTLFARIADAGKNAGLSSQQAQADALGLVETINQTIQLSGASAQASDAALTQLIQGLQGGVLRGEEFNSVMEQAPRLAKALADGLGVTTGELRKMAGEGKLTAEVVMGALRGQAAAVAAEFGKLPATVGRSLQNLQTRWAQYIAENDKGLVSTENLAKVIDALGKNLDELIGTLTMAGKAWAAIKIAALAADALRWAAATGSATTAVQANTAATTANTAAHVSNAAAVRGSAAAQTASAAAASSSAAKVGGAIGGLVTNVVKFNAALAILVNADVIGKWLGETAAKWAGYGKAVEDAEAAQVREQAHAEGRAQQMANMNRLLAENAQRMRDSRDRTFDLSASAIKLVSDFDALTGKGKSASEAISEIGKDFDLRTVAGFRDAGAVLDQLQSDAKITAEQFRAAWAKALDGKDLGVFETTARAAFAGSAREAERMAAVLDTTAREAIRRTGLDFDEISGGMSAASRSALNDTETIISGLGRLRDQGVDTGRVLAISLSKSIDTATTQQALDAVRGQIEQVRSALGNKVADGLLDQAAQRAEALKKALEDATPGVNSVAEAMRGLGITTDKALKETADSARRNYGAMVDSGQASSRELAEGFRRAAEAAIAANNGIAPAWVSSEAAARGYRVVVDEAGKATLQLSKSGDFGPLVSGWNSAASAAKNYADTLGVIKSNSDSIKSTQVSGQTRTAGNDLGTRTAIAAFAKAQGVADDEIARQIANDFADEKGEIRYFDNPGMRKYGRDGDTLSMAVTRAVEQYTFGTGAGAKSIPKPEASRPVTLNLQINGQGYGQINTDAQGQAAFTAFLEAVQRAQGTSVIR